ncbi:MAG: hypothetical protein UU93_C0007G0017 [Candidatus Amesbacteria bacterium GW2011_GWA2_42_12]|uniref:Uncharacterized protein n=1 Tax=Candidatus Amesbacteria bacterium GW2011_GWA2_42_12 TaxID=1618356 RepID=A0A0G0Y6S3_9BACT|nr:MAG: hypothetical protein UU93_C0007G0017 [Candidatus Amesbacteria bacterium GW2011_GWA2_42_12]
MTSLNLQKKDKVLQEEYMKFQIEETKEPVVNLEKKESRKGIWSIFSQFVMIGGDLV